MNRKHAAAFEALWAAGACILPLVIWLIDGRTVLAVTAATYQFYLFLPSCLLALWGLSRRRLRRHLPSMVAALVFLWIYGAQWWPLRLFPSPDPSGLVVMTHNVQLSWGQPQRQRDVILRAGPDLIALQEVNTRPDGLLALLAQAGYSCEHRTYSSKRFGPGLALCSKGRLELVKVQRRTYHPKGRWPYLFAEVRHGDTVFNVIVPHLLAFGISRVDPLRETGNVLERIRRASQWHRQEARALTELLSRLSDPTIVAGDFNSTPEHALHGQLRRHLRDAFSEAGYGLGATYRYLLPLRIDYVYVTPDIEVLGARVDEAGGSDHRPMLATIRLP